MQAGGDTVSLAHGVNSSHLFSGVEAEIDRTAMLAKGDALSSAFRNLAGPSATGMAWETGLGQGTALTFATLFGNQADKPSDWISVSPYAEQNTSQSNVSVMAARLTAPVGPIRLGFESGVVLERNTLLGSASEGAMSLGEGANTAYVGLSAEASVGAGLSLFGGFEVGRTFVRSSADSLVSGMSDLTSTAFRHRRSGRPDGVGLEPAAPRRFRHRLSQPAAKPRHGWQCLSDTKLAERGGGRSGAGLATGVFDKAERR
jgi:hypothetical protein